MSFSTESRTKYKITDEELKKIINHHFNEDMVDYTEIKSGFYNTIFIVSLSDKNVVVKFAPSSDTDILTYEENIIEREIKVYELFDDILVPVPKVLVYDDSKELINTKYYIMSEILGDNLSEVDKETNKDKYYFKLMEYLAKIHSVRMDTFGYDNLKYKSSNMEDAYKLMIANLVTDAKRKEIQFPSYVNELLTNITTFTSHLNNMKSPSLLHFDLWEGNILVNENEITGLIDTERSFNGENIAEFVGMHFDIFNPDNLKFIEHYNKYATNKITLNRDTQIRFSLYKVYLYLLIVVECPFRDIDGSFNDQMNWGLNELKVLNMFFRE